MALETRTELLAYYMRLSMELRHRQLRQRLRLPFFFNQIMSTLILPLMSGIHTTAATDHMQAELSIPKKKMEKWGISCMLS